MLSSLLVCSGLLLVTAYFGQQLFPQSRKYRQVVGRINRAETQQSEQQLFIRCLEQLETTQALLESGIDETTSGVKELHMEIAAIPFDILEAIPVTRHTSKAVRGIHDLISNGVYSAISASNQIAGSASRSGLKNTKPDSSSNKDSPSKKP